MGINSRQKGKRGELEVGRILYRAHYGAEPPPDRTVFVRTKPGVRQNQGDLVIPEDFAINGVPFFVEVKNREFCLSDLTHKTFEDMVSKAYQAASEANAHLLFIFKSHRQWWVLTKPLPIEPKPALKWNLFILLPLAQFCQWWQNERGNSNEGTKLPELPETA